MRAWHERCDATRKEQMRAGDACDGSLRRGCGEAGWLREREECALLLRRFDIEFCEVDGEVRGGALLWILVDADERVGLVVESILQRDHHHLQTVAMTLRPDEREREERERRASKT